MTETTEHKEPPTVRLQVAVGAQVTHLEPRGYYLLRLPGWASSEAVRHVAAQVRTFLGDAGPDTPRMAVLAGDMTLDQATGDGRQASGDLDESDAS